MRIIFLYIANFFFFEIIHSVNRQNNERTWSLFAVTGMFTLIPLIVFPAQVFYADYNGIIMSPSDLEDDVIKFILALMMRMLLTVYFTFKQLKMQNARPKLFRRHKHPKRV